MNKLDFGAGDQRFKGYYNVDILKKKGIDKSFDFDKFPYPLKDNSFDEIRCHSVLEHCNYPKRVLAELWRISKPNGIIDICVPYVNSRSAYATIDHTSYFNRWSFMGLNDFNQNGETFELLENKITKQRFLRWVPMPMLNIMSTFLTNVFIEIDAKLKVIK